MEYSTPHSTQTKVASILGVDRSTVGRWLNAGILRAHYVDGLRFVDMASVRALQGRLLPWRLDERAEAVEGTSP